MFKYRLHSPDGDDLGEATYAQMLHPGEEIGLISVFFLDLAFVSLLHGWASIRADGLVGTCPCVHH